MLKEYFKTALIYLSAGASAILIAILVTPHLNNNLDQDDLVLFGKLMTYYGIGITLCSLAIPNSLVIFKNNCSDTEYLKILLSLPYYYFISTVIYVILLKLTNFSLDLYYLCCLFALIYLTLIFNSINMNYQAKLQKWTSFSLTIGFALSLVTFYFLFSSFSHTNLLSLRLLIPVFFYFGVFLFFYRKLYRKLITKNSELNTYCKKIFPHILAGIILTQGDRFVALKFYEQESVGYILAAIYFSPLIMFGIQFNNSFKPFFFKIIANKIVRVKMLFIYSIVTIAVSVVFYFTINFLLLKILDSSNLQYRDFALVICVLFTLLNLYNPWGAILIYLKKENILSRTTTLFAVIVIIAMTFFLRTDSFTYITNIFVSIHGMYLLTVMFIALNKLKWN